MGVSTYCLIWSFWLAKTKQAPRGIIYWLPADSDVSDFVSTKVNPFITDNDELVDNKALAAGKSTDNQGLKFMYGTPIFFRGLRSKTKVKSISADVSIFDEFDEADPSQVAQARKRTSASEVKLLRELSTPKIPDHGINKRFLETDQCFYAFKCKACGHWNILEDQFPNCFQQDRDGTWYHACQRCKKHLDVSEGRWVQKESGKYMRGYHISQLYSPFVSPDEIMKEYQTTEHIGHFYNHVLGMPYLSATDRVTTEMVLGLCDPMRPMSANNIKPTVMGVDVGSKLHTVILEPGTPHKVVWVGEPSRFEELDPIMLKYNVREAVFDFLPETRAVREFIARHNRKAWGCYYVDGQKGSYAWNEENRQVNVGRTESMDVGQDLIINSKISLPQRNPMVEMLAKHCANVVKVPETNKETGAVKMAYFRIGPDHLRHGLNYALIAASRMRSGSVVSVFR